MKKHTKNKSDCYKLAPLLQLVAYCRLILLQAFYKNHMRNF